jgi:hypothetical protein
MTINHHPYGGDITSHAIRDHSSLPGPHASFGCPLSLARPRPTNSRFFGLNADRLDHPGYLLGSPPPYTKPQSGGTRRGTRICVEAYAPGISRGHPSPLSSNGYYWDHSPSWLQSHTILLYKKGDPTRLDNYRPITLANALCKLWTTYIVILDTDYIESHKIPSAEQEGFIYDRSCERAITHLALCVEDVHSHKRT